MLPACQSLWPGRSPSTTFPTVKDIAPPIGAKPITSANPPRPRTTASGVDLELRHSSSAPPYDIQFTNKADLIPNGQGQGQPATLVLEPLPGPPELAPAPRPISVGVPQPELHPLLAAMEAFLDDRTDVAVSRLKQYHPKDQEFLLRVLPLLAKVEHGGLLAGPMSDEDRTNLLEAMRGLAADLRTSAPLIMQNATFCRKVWGFGKLEAAPNNSFRAGDQIGLYFEVVNLAERRLSDSQHAVHLASTLTILGPDGKPRHSVPVQSTPDISRSPRQDYFAVIRFRLPAELAPGLYTLHIEMKDELTQRKAEKSMRFRISTMTAQP